MRARGPQAAPSPIDTPQPAQYDSEIAIRGLHHSLRILQHIKEIEVCRLTEADIVRHDLVQRIVQAYDTATSGEAV